MKAKYRSRGEQVMLPVEKPLPGDYLLFRDEDGDLIVASGYMQGCLWEEDLPWMDEPYKLYALTVKAPFVFDPKSASVKEWEAPTPLEYVQWVKEKRGG